MERRKAQRFSVNIKTEYSIMPDGEKEGFHEGLILNISKTGLFLSSPTPLGVGENIAIMFDISWEDIEVPVGVIGTVVREQDGFAKKNPRNHSYGYGVQFTSPRLAAMSVDLQPTSA